MSYIAQLENYISKSKESRICKECPIYEDCCSIAYDGYDCNRLLKRKLKEAENGKREIQTL